jgi:HK97 family phage portal protein
VNLFGLTIARTKALELRTKAAMGPLQPLSSRGGWWSIIREPFIGAWQSNQEIKLDNVLTYYAVYACIRLISTDIGKMCFRLMQQDDDGIWNETTSNAFSPVLRKPNRYQTINKYIEQYILSKLIHGNAYVLKDRDQRGIVKALYVLDPTRVIPMVSTDGAVFYELRRDDLSGLRTEVITVPASEIIHDTMIAPFHPLIGVSPLYACALAALEGLSIQQNSSTFFANRSSPDGILTAPVGITEEQALALQATWKARAAGNIAVLAGDLKYQQLSITANDAQLIEQLKWTAENVCSAFGVPPYLVDIGPPPPYANFEPLLLKYHSQCIQSLATNLEKSHDEGLGLLEKVEGKQYGTELDIDDLIWMDTATRVESANKSIQGGGMAVNEARKKYHGLGKVKGGETPFLQNQMWPIEQLAERETPAAPAAPALPAMPVVDDAAETEKAMRLFDHVKALVVVQSHAHADELRAA